MFSLRSGYVVGYDIQSELHVFNLTAANHRWLLSSESDAYNATLSLTILPTILKEFLHTGTDTIFKFYFPLLGATMPGIIFAISRKILGYAESIIVALFFIVQSQFLQEMPALCRQEIAFVFFLLFLYAMFEKNMIQATKKALFLIFGLSIVVSHYSTGYVALSILILAYIINRAISVYAGKSKDKTELVFPSPVILFVLLMAALFWYGQISNSTGNINSAVSAVFHNISQIGSDEQKSVAVQQAIGANVNSNQVNVYNYSRQIFDQKSFSSYRTSALDSPRAPTQVTVRNENVASAVLFANITVQRIFKLLLGIGFVALMVNVLRRRERRVIYIALFALSFAFLVSIATIIILPSLSEFYNLERLYQQALPVLGIIIVIGLITLTGIKPLVRLRLPVLFILVVLYFFNYSGFMTQIFGGDPTMQLSNFGGAYDEYYKQSGAVDAISWIVVNRTAETQLSSDYYGGVMMRTDFSPSIKIKSNITEEALTPKSMIFVTYANLRSGIAFDEYNNYVVSYSFPAQLIQDNKSLVYSNSDSQVYE
jgi:uncharacterized membrane protein